MFARNGRDITDNKKKKKTIIGDFCGGERENKINQEQSML